MLDHCPTDDYQLQQLVQDAQQYSPQSPQRQVALSRLMAEICASHELGHPQQASWPARLYEDLYNEALQQTLLDICQSIEHYNPSFSVMAWVNFRLNKNFISIVRDLYKRGLTYVPKSFTHIVVELPSLETLEQLLVIEDWCGDRQLLYKFLEDDPEGQLNSEFLRNRPDITFQIVAQARAVEGKSWEEMAEDFGISVQTLCSFFNRRFNRLLPYFRKYLQV